MSKFGQDVQDLLQYIGGVENISAVTCCATRMCFVLKNPSKTQVKEIEALKTVKGTFTQAGQFQVIIGSEVVSFYLEFTKITGLKEANKEEAQEAAKANMTFLQRIMADLAELFLPLIPALVIGGLILGFRNIIGDINLMDSGTKSLVEVSQFWSGIHHFLWLIGEAIFHFLPVGVTWSVTKKMGTTQILGIILGITLVSPQLLNAWGVPETLQEEISYWDIGILDLYK